MNNRRRRKKGNSNEQKVAKYNRYEVIPTRKVISAYGGVGSILETPNGSVMIEPFNKWNFFKDETLWRDTKNHIEDKRFLQRLKLKFEKLECLVKVPENEIRKIDQKTTIAAEYFPRWMYCPKCFSFDRLKNWLKQWKDVAKNTNYHPPKCFKCYSNALDKKENRKYYDLEQVRFILTSPSGEIADIPWDRWVFAKVQRQDENDIENTKKITSLDFEKEIPTNVFYEYRTSDKFNNLTGISIRAVSRKTGKLVKQQTLSGLFGLKVPGFLIHDYGGKAMMKVVIRSSNSVYYPNILQSLQLPLGSTGATTEVAYRTAEFQFITSIEKDYESDDGFLSIEKLDKSIFSVKGMKNIYRFDSLKMTSVQVSYTRQEPIDKDYYLRDDLELVNEQGQKIKKKLTSTFGLRTKMLPAIENLGEGIFFEFDEEVISAWQEKFGDQLNRRTESIQENYEETKFNEYEFRAISPKYLLIHTFSHLIIKELEFLSGYPATSLQERLYISDEMQGVLIYTIAGAEGSYGGLVSLCDTDAINKIIKSALERATDCASDPICENTDEHGQGVGGTNLAACYSCALLPETSCEEFNRFLDRVTLVNRDFSFFKTKG